MNVGLKLSFKLVLKSLAKKTGSSQAYSLKIFPKPAAGIVKNKAPKTSAIHNIIKITLFDSPDSWAIIKL